MTIEHLNSIACGLGFFGGFVLRLAADLGPRNAAPSPDIAPTFYCGARTARPERRSLGRNARHTVEYACAFLGRERHSCRTLRPPRDERWCNIRASGLDHCAQPLYLSANGRTGEPFMGDAV